MPYNRDVVVNCIKRHYELLVRAAYLDPNVIRQPPAEGWGDDKLDVDLLRALKRSEKVIDLLRHLPYIDLNLAEDCEVYVYTTPISYLRGEGYSEDSSPKSRAAQGFASLGLMPADADWPAGMISLTRGQVATWWIIDTEKDVVWPAGMFNVDDEAPDEEPWRQLSHPRGIEEYFNEIYSSVLSLKIVPVPTGKLGGWHNEMANCDWPKGQMVKRILEEHGWPNNIDKERYLEALPEHDPNATPSEGSI